MSPWLHFSADFDPWLEQNRCLIEAWCDTNVLIAPPLGVLFALGAFGAFALTMWMEHGMPLRWKTAMDTHQIIFIRITLLLLMMGAVTFQAIQLLYYHTSPSALVWLIGVSSLFAFGLALDWRQTNWHNTLANLLVILGLMILLLGAAGLLLRVDPYHWAVILFGGGLAIFTLGSRWAAKIGSSFTPTDHVLIILIACTHLALALMYAWSWRFAFIGDEWGFFEVARALNHGATDLKWFETRDSNNFHTVLSMQFQAWVMRLYGEDIATWRLSAVLPGAFSVPAIYVIGHRLGGRHAAVLSAGAFAVSHTLLCFAMIPYNNTQALLPMTAGVALFIFAIQRESTLRYLLIGMVLGLSFIVYGLARLAVIPVGMFWLFYSWPNFRTAFRRLVEIGSGALVVAAPILLNLNSWQSLLKATPVQSEVAPTELTLAAQIVRNVLSGLLAFLTNPANTHFVIGPYVDPLTAVFVLIGVCYLVVTIGRQRIPTAWLLGSLLLLVAMSGIQQYSRIATTRMFSSVAIFAVYAGIGGAAFLKLLLPTNRWVQYGGVGVLLAALIVVNQYHITNVTFPNSEKPNIPLIVQQFQESAASDGSGMPVFVVDNDPANSMLKLILQAYQVGQERIMLLTEEEALQLPYVCDAGQAEALFIMPTEVSKAQEIRNRLTSCWPNLQETPLRNRAEETTLYRFASAAAQLALKLAPQERQHAEVGVSNLLIRGAQALTVAPDDTTFVLSAAKQQVIRYSARVQQLHAFSITQRHPSAIAVDEAERIVVVGGEDKLVWYDFAGNVLQKTSAGRELYRPFGLAVINQQELLVTDLDRRQFARISAQGELIETFVVPGIEWPAALAVSDDQQSAWVYDAQLGTVTKISLPSRTILQQVSSRHTGAEDAVALTLLPNQHLLQTVPQQRRLIERDPQGEIIRIWSGFDQPTALAANADSQIFVLDRKLEEVYILPALYTSAPEPDLVRTAPVSQKQYRPTATAPESPLSPLATPPAD
ncbi:MAG: glycosyltransferase family 39 protein [Caldilineaceae bacterium]